MFAQLLSGQVTNMVFWNFRQKKPYSNSVVFEATFHMTWLVDLVPGGNTLDRVLGSIPEHSASDGLGFETVGTVNNLYNSIITQYLSQRLPIVVTEPRLNLSPWRSSITRASRNSITRLSAIHYRSQHHAAAGVNLTYSPGLPI
jgi:hypothetical protein